MSPVRDMGVSVSVQAEPRDATSWTALARHLQDAGFAALLVADHPGSGTAPWTALGAAAAVTDTFGVGTYMLNVGVRDPLLVAAEAATLDVLAPGRVHPGLGAGHTPTEWTQVGVVRPAVAERVERLARPSPPSGTCSLEAPSPWQDATSTSTTRA